MEGLPNRLYLLSLLFCIALRPALWRCQVLSLCPFMKSQHLSLQRHARSCFHSSWYPSWPKWSVGYFGQGSFGAAGNGWGLVPSLLRRNGNIVATIGIKLESSGSRNTSTNTHKCWLHLGMWPITWLVNFSYCRLRLRHQFEQYCCNRKSVTGTKPTR